MPKGRGLTLFELLTVLAIVGALAAIMFPVMAQARGAAQKTSALARMRQTATSLVLYSVDHDDTMPLSGPVDNGSITGSPGAYLPGWVAGFPNGWDGVEWEESDAVAWPNSSAVYRFGDGVMFATDLPPVQLSHFEGPSPYLKPRKEPKPSSFTMNGLLHAWSTTAVAMPSRLTLLWQGAYRAAVSGYAYSNPILYCNAGTMAPCRFQPQSFPQEGAVNSKFRGDIVYLPFGDDTAWIYGRGMNFVAVDTSARWRPQNPTGQTSQMVRSYDDPAGQYGPGGQQRSFHRCVLGQGTRVRYTSFFRPDSEFAYEFGATLDTRCDPR